MVSPLHIASKPPTQRQASPRGPREQPAQSVLKNAMALRRMNSEVNYSPSLSNLDRETKPMAITSAFIGVANLSGPRDDRDSRSYGRPGGLDRGPPTRIGLFALTSSPILPSLGASLTPSPDGRTARFHGNLDTSTLGGAGFASQHSKGVQHWDLSMYDGIFVKLEPGQKPNAREVETQIHWGHAEEPPFSVHNTIVVCKREGTCATKCMPSQESNRRKWIIKESG